MINMRIIMNYDLIKIYIFIHFFTESLPISKQYKFFVYTIT